MEYFFDGKHCRWIPDFAVTVRDDSRRVFVEVKTLIEFYPEDAEEAGHAGAKCAAIERTAIREATRFALYTKATPQESGRSSSRQGNVADRRDAIQEAASQRLPNTGKPMQPVRQYTKSAARPFDQ